MVFKKTLIANNLLSILPYKLHYFNTPQKKNITTIEQAKKTTITIVTSTISCDNYTV